MLQILAVTFPFFALVLVGYLAARGRLLPIDAIPGLNSFVLFFALPCMLYRFAAGTPIVGMLDPGITVTWLVCALAMVTLAIATTRRGPVGWNDASFGALVAAFPNSGFMGVPLLVALLGARAAGPVIASMAIDMVVTSSLCIALSRLDHAGANGFRSAAMQALKGMVVNPLPWSIGLGMLSAATGIVPPEPAMRTVAMLADGASPVALFTLGALLARAERATTAAGRGAPGRVRSDVPQVVFYKLALHPALVFVTGKILSAAGLALDGFALTALVLAAALPSASNVPMLAERYGADASRIARIVLVSTTLAFGSFSAAVALLR